MRVVIFSLLLVFQFSSLAQGKSCMDSTLELYYSNYTNLPDGYVVPSATKACLSGNSKFKSLQESMCDSDGTLAAEYEAYMGYAKDFKRTLKERDNSTSRAQREFLNSELRAIENEWMIFGYRWELSSSLSIIFDLVNGECWNKSQ